MDSTSNNNAKQQRNDFSMQDYEFLLAEADAEIKSTNEDLDEARELAKKAGLSTESDLPSMVKQFREGNTSGTLTGGYSNTDHLIVLTGDYVTDRITELRRNLITRCRAEQPESRSQERWDKPRTPGGRRRRIVREKDLPTAPPEPPPSGYIIFVSQYTTKVRHDRRNERHDQAKVIYEISRLWGMALTDEDRTYYENFAEETRKEYKKQLLEFRATGTYTPSNKFERIEGTGLWVHKNMEDKNALELEIASYDTVVFPARPPEYDEEYERRQKESLERRKEKLRAEREANAKKFGKPVRTRKRKKSNNNNNLDSPEEDRTINKNDNNDQKDNDQSETMSDSGTKEICCADSTPLKAETKENDNPK